MAIFILMMLDYILTYAGITSGLITEGNPLLDALFQSSFLQGLSNRFAYSAVILIIFRYIRKTDVKIYIRTNIVMGAVYYFVFMLHLQWMVNSDFIASIPNICF